MSGWLNNSWFFIVISSDATTITGMEAGVWRSIFPGSRLFFCAKERLNIVTPVLQALLLADHVYQDKATGKKIVVGIFHTLHFVKKKSFQEEIQRRGGQLPLSPGGYQAGSPFAYISLTDIHGEQEFVVRYVSLSDDAVMFQCAFKVDAKDPLKIVDLILPLPPLPATQSGVFALELLWHDEPLGSYRLLVE